MKKHIAKLTFVWDDGDESGLYEIATPEHVTSSEVNEALKAAHKFLCEEDEEDRYGYDGRCPETLLSYLRKKTGWSWNELVFDINTEFI